MIKIPSMDSHIVKLFKQNVSFDGKIVIFSDTIVKIKPSSHLTIDLQYDALDNIFLDNEKNVYTSRYVTPSNEVKRVMEMIPNTL